MSKTLLSSPPFIADRASITRDTGHTIDWAKVPESYRQTPGGTVTVAATAAIDAVSVTVAALPIALPSGTVLDFGGKKFARLTAAAAKGATTLAVAALATALANADTALVAGSGPKVIPAGTRMGEAGTNGTIYPRVASTNPATCILATPAVEDAENHARSTYGVIRGGALYENLLPGATGTPKVILSAEKTELAAAGTGFAWLQYIDSTN